MAPYAKYFCSSPDCKEEFDTLKAAEDHENVANASAGEQIVKVGDIVSVNSGYGWFDGDPLWVIKPTAQDIPKDWPSEAPIKSIPTRKRCPRGDSNCFSECCTYTFLYVVTDIRMSEHRWKYSVVTKAMGGGHAHAFWGGWTRPVTHYTPKVMANPPPEVVAGSKEFLGQVMRNLL